MMTMMPALLDVVVCEAESRATANVDVPSIMPVFDTHFPLRPVLPGVLILQSLADLATRYIEDQGWGRLRLKGFRAVKFRQPVEPGQRMELAVVEQPRVGDVMVLGGKVTVGGRVALSVGQILLGPGNCP